MILIILAVILAIVGLLGSVLPGLPGPPLSWAALLMVQLSDKGHYSPTFMVVTAIAAAIITVLDYVVPSWSTKRHGGSKAGIWGCNIGLMISIIGLPFGPQGLLGVVFWPFIGALIGELLSGKAQKEAFHAAWGAFVGFLAGTGLKLAYAIFAIIFVIKEIF